jgi:hypothetical protein
MIDRTSTGSYSARCGDQSGCKDVKNGLSVAQLEQNGEGDRSLTREQFRVLPTRTTASDQKYGFEKSGSSGYLCMPR